MKRILVLTDLSEIADHGIHAAFSIAEKIKASVKILYAVEGGVSLHGDFDKTNNFQFQLNDLNLQNQINAWKELSEKKSVKTIFQIENTILFPFLDNLLANESYDLIVMGGTGIGKSKEFWGSTTEMTIQYADIPVLVVKERLEKAIFQKVIFASSFNNQDKTAFSIMLNLLPLSPSTIFYLLAINTESYFMQPAPLMDEVMNDFVELASPYRCEKRFYRDYNINAGIRHFAEEINPNLIVMSDKHKKPFKHLIFGHEAVKVASQANYPVLIIDY